MKFFRKNRRSLRASTDKQFLRSRPAETLIEVIMSIFIIATGSAAATSLIVTALQSNSFSRDNLIALNLAVEGIEATTNIQESNWLKFGFDKENCWNMEPDKATCADMDLIQGGNYTVDLDIGTMQWLLSKSANVLDLGDGVTATDNFYQLKFLDLDGVGEDRDLYVSANLQLSGGAAFSGDSIFYRMITVEYTTPAPDDTPEEADEITITSLVQWKAQNRVHKVELTTKLTNYQKVKTS